jgi:ParB-like chromosome segregation protein Spo0J
MDPHKVRFDDKYVVFNPVHKDREYEATRNSIKMLGQQEPILMLNGLCVNGRHRVRIAIELGVSVRCIDLDEKMSKEEIISICNMKNIILG